MAWQRKKNQWKKYEDRNVAGAKTDKWHSFAKSRVAWQRRLTPGLQKNIFATCLFECDRIFRYKIQVFNEKFELLKNHSKYS